MTFDEWFSKAYPYDDIDVFEKNMARASWDAATTASNEKYKLAAHILGYNNGMCNIATLDPSVVLPIGLALYKHEG